MTLINLTPHDITVLNGEVSKTYPASGQIARVAEAKFPTRSVDGVPVSLVRYAKIQGLPPKSMQQSYIVSLLTVLIAAATNRGTEDLYYPGELIRGTKGEIIGCQGLYQLDLDY